MLDIVVMHENLNSIMSVYTRRLAKVVWWALRVGDSFIERALPWLSGQNNHPAQKDCSAVH